MFSLWEGHTAVSVDTHLGQRHVLSNSEKSIISLIG